MTSAETPTRKAIDVFFYPPVYVMLDGSRTGSPITFSAEQATTQVPLIPEMAGIKVISYWSQFCPTVKSCDFDMLSQILEYWHAKGKKVILDVATWGMPFRWQETATYEIKNGTPDWVLHNVTTFRQQQNVLFNTAIGAPEVSAIYPAYWDQRFVAYVKVLADHLRIFDGNPTIAQMIIPIGLLGEDNPSLPGISPTNSENQKHVPGFTPLNYIQYAKTISDIYIQAFPHTQLVVDLGGIPTIYAKSGAEAKREADEYIDYLIAHHVMLAFDGWQSGTAASLPHVASGPYDSDPTARILYYLRRAREHGDPIGLEVVSVTSDSFKDPQAGLAALQAIAPSRVVMMKDSDAAIYTKRNGNDAAHPSLGQDRGVDPVGAASFAEQVLKATGHL